MAEGEYLRKELLPWWVLPLATLHPKVGVYIVPLCICEYGYGYGYEYGHKYEYEYDYECGHKLYNRQSTLH